MWGVSSTSGARGADNGETEELCLMDCGLTSLTAITLPSSLRSLNVHCNQIREITGLSHLTLLTHLDLSSNQISRMEGLSWLSSLRTLNLACNLIMAVEGLQDLKSLVKLNLSFNQIINLNGFRVIRDTSHRLSHLELHGNRIDSLEHITQCLNDCDNLRHLTLSQSGADNPVCSRLDYRQHILQQLPYLQVLDGSDRHGQPVLADDVLADIPGLDQYLEYLTSGSTPEPNPISMATPRIDAVLQMFKEQGVTTPELTSNTELDTSHHTDSEQKPATDNQLRIEKLEQQIASLLATPKNAESSAKNVTNPLQPKIIKHVRPRRDIDLTDDSGGETSSPERPRTARRTPNYQRQTAAYKNRDVQSKPKPADAKNVRVLGRGYTPTSSSSSKTSSAQKRTPTSVAADQQKRDELQSTYVTLMEELENERERRWKAEQAAKKLVDHVKELHSKSQEEKNLNEVAIESSKRLKELLTNEKEAKLRLQAELEVTQEEIKSLGARFEASQKSGDEQQSALRAAQDTMARMERERLQQEAHQARKIQESQAKAAALTRELEIVRSQVTSLKGQVQQLQELLANREQEHREQMASRYKLGSAEIQEAMKEERARIEKVHADELRVQQQRIDAMSKQYADLEDEFRMALTIEANRFKEIKRAFETLSEESANNKAALLTAHDKEEKTATVLTELTSLVKEQKGRITELTRCKQEQGVEHRDRIETLELHLEEARRRMVQFELLKQEKAKLTAELQAQSSVIEGLRMERKVWGEELAQQGSSLAADRGRMEAKIASLTAEVNNLNKQLHQEADSVRIKTKVIDDQTETIRKLKEGLVERDNDVRSAREENLRIQRSLEDQLSAETSNYQDMQERYERALSRKEELKQNVEELEDALDEAKKAQSTSEHKWKERSSAISELEKQVSAMKSSWQAKEAKITQERDRAVDAARIAVEKIRAMDDAFRRQLDAKVESHQREMEELEADKQEEVDAANKHVIEVEEEMRQLLQETAKNKHAMEQRLKNLSQAFADVQQGIS